MLPTGWANAANLWNPIFRLLENPQETQQRQQIKLLAATVKIASLATVIFSTACALAAIIEGQLLSSIYYISCSVLCFDLFKISEKFSETVGNPAQFAVFQLLPVENKARLLMEKTLITLNIWDTFLIE